MTGSTQKKILMVEDELDLCEIIQEFLSDYDWGVTPCQTLEEAAQLLMADDWALLLVDFHLAFSTTTELLNLNARTRKIPVILMTGAPTAETIQIDKSLYQHLLVKPFSIRQLVDLLTTLERKAP